MNIRITRQFNCLIIASITMLLTFNISLNAQTYAPVEDTYIRGGTDYETLNFGTDTLLYIKQGSSAKFNRKAMLKFDLTSVGFGTVNITNAILRLYAESADICTIAVYEYPSDWSETSITWSTAAALGNKINETAMGVSGTYYEWDVTSYIQAQSSGTEYVSLALYDEVGSTVTIKASSREAVANHPELIITTGDLTLPAAPSNLSAIAMSNEEILLNWMDNSVNEEGFKIERKIVDASFAEIAQVSATVTSFVDSGLTNFVSYTYRVRAYNSAGNSAYSNEATDTTTDTPESFEYYVDAVNGDDLNSGLSSDEPWKSLDKVNATTFLPGSSILFKSGDIWVGQLYPKGSGTNERPIKIDKYGGDTKPIIDGNGMIGTGVVYLYNQEYWEISNIEITNDADFEAYRRGVRIEVDNYGTANHIHLKNLYIHNVKGSIGKETEDKRTAAIGFAIVDGSAIPTHFNDILVEGCEIHDCSNVGIITECVAGHGFEPGTDEWERIKITNLAIRNNTLYNIAKNAIVVRLSEGGVVENNVIHHTSVGNITGNTIFSAACDSTVFQFNEGYENQSPDADGSLYDADLRSPRTIWQYSYSHDNAHGLFWTCTKPNDYDVICRYNISQNDKGIIFCMNYPNTSVYNYNNTVYIGEDLAPLIISERGNGGDESRTYYFENNIIYNLGNGYYGYNTSKYTRYIDNNCFYGNHPSSEPDDSNKITIDPMFVAPGTGGNGMNTVDGYKLQEGSPCIDAGKIIANNGGFDYWGNALNDGLTDIGAHEFIVVEDTIPVDTVSVNEFFIANQEQFTIYPNPVNQKTFNIDLNTMTDVSQVNVKIFNCKGQLVYNSDFYNQYILNIDAQNLPGGSIYFVSVHTNQLVLSKKLVIN
jgi:hypothetical protein